MHWRTDSTLQRRMVAALVLSLLGYAALIGLVVALFPPQLSLVAGGVLVVVLGVLVYEADRIAYLVTKAVSISREDYPVAYDTLHRLAHQADVAPPALAVVPTDEPNAITAGTGGRSVVCVTLGLIKRLDDDELEAVLAHEIAHLKNGDTAVMTVAGFPATLGVVMLSLSARSVGWKAFFFGYLFVPIYLAVFAVPLLIASLPGTVVLSRYREYAADRGAVALTGDAAALATALGELHGASIDPPDRDLRRVAGLTAFAIVPTSCSSTVLPSMHPPTAERIRRLKELTRDVSRDADGEP